MDSINSVSVELGKTKLIVSTVGILNLRTNDYDSEGVYLKEKISIGQISHDNGILSATLNFIPNQKERSDLVDQGVRSSTFVKTLKDDELEVSCILRGRSGRIYHRKFSIDTEERLRGELLGFTHLENNVHSIKMFLPSRELWGSGDGPMKVNIKTFSPEQYPKVGIQHGVENLIPQSIFGDQSLDIEVSPKNQVSNLMNAFASGFNQDRKERSESKKTVTFAPKLVEVKQLVPQALVIEMPNVNEEETDEDFTKFSELDGEEILELLDEDIYEELLSVVHEDGSENEGEESADSESDAESEADSKTEVGSDSEVESVGAESLSEDEKMEEDEY